MDVELQILKHLARDAHPTVAIVDEYCAEYKDLFKEVRNYECFKYLHLGIISMLKRKSLPEIAKVVSINSAQSLHHFLANSNWSVDKLKQRRLSRLKKALDGNAITVVIDETGDRKKGKKTDYVARQYLGSVGKVDNGIVSVNAYGVYANITFPLIFREIIYGKKRAITYWEITTDPETMPENSTSFVMTNLQGNLKKSLGDLYGLRTWVEYGFRQCKQELGWTDYRFTNFQHIERW
jgi:SRSO17 transposase